MMSARQRFYQILPLALTLLLLGGAVWVGCFPLQLMQRSLQRERAAIQKTVEKIHAANERNRKSVAALAGLWEMRALAMRQSEQTGTVLFRERIEKTAAKVGLRSRTMGNVRRIDLAENMILFEVSFSADGNTAELVAFLNSLYTDAPRIYWRTLGIKSGAGNILNLTGTMCALCIVPATPSRVAGGGGL